MKTLFLGLLLSAVTLAADVTGKWSGTLESKRDGEAKSEPAYLVLKQDGGKLEGTLGPDESKGYPIQNGKVEGGRLTFEILRRGRAVSFDLTAQGGRIEGEMRVPREGAATESVRLAVQRVVEVADRGSLTGKWSGTLEFKRDGESRSEPALVLLQEEGGVVTGSGGRDESDRHEIQSGKIEGDHLTFEIKAGERVMSFDLRVSGDRIEGEIKRPGRDGNVQTARLSLKRLAEK